MADDITSIYGNLAQARDVEPQVEQTMTPQEQTGLESLPTPNDMSSPSWQEEAYGIGHNLNEQGVSYQGELTDSVHGQFAGPGTPGQEEQSLVADYYGNPAETAPGLYGPETNQPVSEPQTGLICQYGRLPAATNDPPINSEYQLTGSDPQPANDQQPQQEQQMEPGA